MAGQRPPDDPTSRAWPVVFIEPDPVRPVEEKRRHPGRVLFVVLLLMALGAWIAGRSTAPVDLLNENASSPAANPPPGRTVRGLTPPPSDDLPSAPAAEPVDTVSPSLVPTDRRPVVASSPRRRVAPRNAPEPRPSEQPSRIAHLSLNSFPWGLVSIDGSPVGNTPMVSLPVLAGTHRIRIEHAGYVAFDRVLRIAPGETVRLTGVVLQEATP